MPEITFLSEPDNQRIAADLGFIEENRNAASGNIFVMKYPLDSNRYGIAEIAAIERVANDIRAITKYPIIK